MTDPAVFYNREDLWRVASEVGLNTQREQATQAMEPNFVLMTLPGERATEFIEILPFTPANRNNLIGWIAGRSDDPHYGTAVVYDFPKTKLVDGPLQIEARIDGSLIVIPIGRSLLYAEAIYLQAERSPMPELATGRARAAGSPGVRPTFESAMAALFGGASSTLSAPAQGAPAPRALTTPTESSVPPVGDLGAFIAAGARDIADYQRLTAEGKLGEAVTEA